MACPNKSLESWKTLVEAQGEKIAYYLWDKYEGNVPERFNKSINQTLIDGFLKDFNITTEEFENLKDTLGFDAKTASDFLEKVIAYEKGQRISGEAAYFAFSMLGKQNSKIRSDLRYLIYKWPKFRERFTYHTNELKKQKEFYKDKKQWKNAVRDRVIYDFLKENIEAYYLNPVQFEKNLNTRWVSKDFKENMNLWEKFLKWLDDILSMFSDKHQSQSDQLKNLGLGIASEILDRNYEYFKYDLAEGQIQKFYDSTIASDPFAKELVEFGQKDLKLILTGSLAVRRAGTVYRTENENIHDIDWVVPHTLSINSDENLSIVEKIKGYQKGSSKEDREYAAGMAKPLVERLSWYKDFIKKYPSFIITRCFYGSEHDAYESLTVTGVIDVEFYESDGTHEKEISYYVRDPKTQKPVKVKETKTIKHKKGDMIEDTGYVVDFFVRLKPGQDEHENYFKLWKEIFIAKLKMGREKDFIDFKVFIPFTKSQEGFRFNYKAWRHINSESSPNYALEDTYDQKLKETPADRQDIESEEDPFTC
jgi:hypothetical protein